MARKVFHSFHYQADNWRTQMVRNIGALERNEPALPNEWEEVKRGGDAGIRRWIDGQLDGRTCTIVLVGSETAQRRWVYYEIIESWNRGLGVLAVHIHKLEGKDGQQSARGQSPFELIPYLGHTFAGRAKSYDPPYTPSKLVYGHIQQGLEHWVDEAISNRKQFPVKISKVWRQSDSSYQVVTDPATAMAKLEVIMTRLEWTVSSKDAVTGILIASTGGNAFSWGEKVTVRVGRSVFGCEISVESEASVLTSWGNDSKNVGKVLAAIETEMGK